ANLSEQEMRVKANWKTTLRAFLPYLGAVAASMFVLVWTLKLWRADLHVPFYYVGDGLSTQMLVKSAMDNPWYSHNHFLSFPGVMEIEDYPMADRVHYLLIKVISLTSRHSGKVMNLYFLLTFPLTTLVALVVFRRFNMGYFPSLVGSLLFAFTPYH